MSAALHRVVLAALVALAACQNAVLSSDDVGASLSVVVAEATGGPALAPPTPDSVLVILSGPEQRRISASPGETVTIRNLPLGTYTVRLEAYSGTVLVWDGQDTVTVAGGATATATITPNVLEHVPEVTISAPGQSTIVASGDAVTLTATASDQEDGDLTASISWTSDVDGVLGTGGSIAPTLSDGPHTIEASVEDQTSFVGSATVDVTSAPVLLLDELCRDYPGYAIATFEDANLEDAVRSVLAIGAQPYITCSALDGVSEVRADDSGIASVAGIQNVTNLVTLHLSGNSITDIGPLGTLTSLQDLGLAGNSITDLTALQGLTSLDVVLLFNNVNLADIQPLIDNTGLGSGDRVELDNTMVTCADVAALETNGVAVTSSCPVVLLPSQLCADHSASAIATFEDSILEDSVRAELGLSAGDDLLCGDLETILTLSATSAGITSLVGIQNLTVLSAVDLSSNSISDIGSLGGLTNLVDVKLGNNGALMDISALSGLTGLTDLELYSNSITDLSALQGLTKLTILRLDENTSLSNIDPLLNNSGLGPGDAVDLTGTAVSCTDVASLESHGVTVGSDCGSSTP